MKVLSWLDKHVEEVIVGTITIVMLIALFLQVIFRYVINASLGWTEELSVNLMPLFAYFGMSMAVTYRRHLRIDIITNFLPYLWKKIFDLIANIGFFVFAAIISYYTWILTSSYFGKPAVTAVLHIPKWVIYVGIPIAFVLTIYRLIQDTVRTVREIKESRSGDRTEPGSSPNGREGDK